MVHKYESDLAQEVRALQRRVEALEASARRTALTTASAGWQLPNRSTPARPANGAHLYASGGRLWVLQSDNTSFAIEPAPEIPFTQGVAVPDVPVFNSEPSPPQTIEGIWNAYRDLRDDCQSGLRQRIIQLKNSLEGGGFIASP